MSDRPLFIPLKGEYFDAFANGTKTTEYRIYGPRWNRRTCQPGRAVTLSRGYSKRQRLTGRVTGFLAEPIECLAPDTKRELQALFGQNCAAVIACISIELRPR
jgi:hypothetical protein